MSAAGQRARFAQLRALRESGKKTFDSYQVEDVEKLYEEVDEAGYKKIVRDRLNEDDFVVDDNGEGYADDGREEWDRPAPYGSEDDDEEDDELAPRGRPSKTAKKEQEDKQAKRDANDRDISQYFSRGAAKPQPKPKIGKTKEDDDFLAGLLGEVDNSVPAPPSRRPAKKRDRSAQRRNRRREPSPSPGLDTGLPAAKKKKLLDDRVSSPPRQEGGIELDGADLSDLMMDDDPLDIDLDLDPPTGHPALPALPPQRAANSKEQVKVEMIESDEDYFDDTEDAQVVDTADTANANLATPRHITKLADLGISSSPAKAPEPSIDPSSWNRLTEQLNVIGDSTSSEARAPGKLDHNIVVEEDGSLNMFWTDYMEVGGSLCLFGKVKNKKTGAFASCFVKVDNILRKLYFLPRQHRVRNGKTTADEVNLMDVFAEADDLMTKLKVEMHKIKKCTRKYAFELPGIPKEAEYLKLFYPYTKPALGPGTSGETFSHVFGTNTAIFEQFVLWKNIMGPCWLNIKDADFVTLRNASHCRLDVLVPDPATISPISDSHAPDDPPLTMMSVALRTTFNARENKQEILAISGRVYENVALSDTTPAERLPCRTFTVIRPNGPAFPLGFEPLTRKRSRGLIKTVKQESEVLSFFLAQLDLADPDVILGHQLEGVDYSILLNRLHEKKVPQWSRLGRFRRTQWPFAVGRVGSNVFAERQVMAGRLLCDLFNDCGKSTMHKCQSWTLTEMCSLYLGGDDRRRDIDNEAALKTWATSKEGLIDYITHMEADTHFVTALALQVQLLPLTKILTNLAGNSWARTLTGTRAERNEYILLHEFHRNKYICPDKEVSKGHHQRTEQQQQEDDVADGDKKKKDKYKGGLVFEPERGLYDKFVLVMDFNSLYPSIIQEFNICFTTVDRSSLSDDDDGVPDVPTDQDLGILPRLIATLVNRRRQVKSLMKDRGATPQQIATWDIKQLALKLTANSMYGCLGYTRSRFYARPLAVLTTYKGREILRSTKELAESKSLQVIYGDTDSVMINANVESVAEALKVGHEFKLAVNERYRLLEIDIDNVFSRILLQAKKKYAAVSLVEQGGKFVEKMEVKGLDMRRREYCALSKEVSSRLLQEILSGNDTELSIGRIHEYLREIAAKMRARTIPIAKYTIFTQLGKAPGEYPNADSMPQVQVALREIGRGKTVRRGDVVGYIIATTPAIATTGDGGGNGGDGGGGSSIISSSDPPAKRALPPADVRPGSGLVPDAEWYMAKQIFPPVERLCANISGTSTAQLGEQLGLDVGRYGSQQSSSRTVDGGDVEIHPLESQIPDEVRFSDCTRLSLRCRACQASRVFEGLFATPDLVSNSGLICGACGAVMANLSVVAQLEYAIRQHVARYYEGWLVCDDSSCGNRTRQVSVAGGDRCLGPKGLARDCLGRVRYEFSEKAMYNQLLYLATIFDLDKAEARARAGGDGKAEGGGGDVDRILGLVSHNLIRFGTLKGVVDRYLDGCGRQWVGMGVLFAKLGLGSGG